MKIAVTFEEGKIFSILAIRSSLRFMMWKMEQSWAPRWWIRGGRDTERSPDFCRSFR